MEQTDTGAYREGWKNFDVEEKIGNKVDQSDDVTKGINLYDSGETVRTGGLMDGTMESRRSIN